MGLCGIRDCSLAVRFYLAWRLVVGELQRLGTAWSEEPADSIGDLLGGTVWLWPVLYLQCCKHLA